MSRNRTPEQRKREAEAKKRWKERNPEKVRDSQRRYWVANREKRIVLQRARGIRERFGISVEEYEEIIACGCEICGTKDTRICLDHCHATGSNRGALCHRCNSAIGLLDDSAERLRAAAAYLEKHRPGGVQTNESS